MAQPFIPAASVAKAELFMRADSQQLENVWYFQYSSFIDESALAALATCVGNWATNQYVDILGAQVFLSSVKISSMETQDGPISEWTPAITTGGSVGGGEAIPNNCCAVVSWKTALRGRSYRGRTYVPGLRSTQLVGNSLAAAYSTAVRTTFEGLEDATGELGWALVVFSRKHNGVWRTTAATPPVTSFTINPYVASQRRRLPGRGV